MKAIRVILTLVFAWTALKGVEVLFRTTSMDSQLFESAGVTWLLYVLLVPAVLCYIGGLAWIWRPFSKGLLVSLLAILLNLAETSTAVLISVGNTDLAKKAFVASREARGLPIRQEVLKMMDSPFAHAMPLAIGIPLAALWIVLLAKTNKHHLARSEEASVSGDG